MTMNLVSIVPMEEKHIEKVYYIEKTSFVLPWTKKDFIEELKKDYMAIYFVALYDGEVCGYGGMWHVVNEGHITNVAVHPDFRRKGIADAIVKRLISESLQKQMIGITLEVKISNTGAQKLYTKNGFKPEGFRKNYYQDTGEDAIIMWYYNDNI